jgi:hypothetical protein
LRKDEDLEKQIRVLRKDEGLEKRLEFRKAN